MARVSQLSVIYRSKSIAVTLIISAVFSLLVYFVLSYLLVTQRVTIPVSILMFTLLFGLTRYYSKSRIDDNSQIRIQNRNESRQNGSLSNILFLAIFFILILTYGLFSKKVSVFLCLV